MPTYDYRCETNDRIVEVQHRMSETLSTWGEVCARAGIETGDTPSETPVHRLATGGNIIGSQRLGSGPAPAPACGTGGCCPSGFCGLN
ncbi:zinc ribbon domain-containing protein [Thioalkalicoccus limnaeus]|uniref:Zinc ribbon domain-containing protein n=1 Tax=Thioalkalicoccus limnaeus TaxID=120681 RepID=A0ABV4BEM7_9GAMM